MTQQTKRRFGFRRKSTTTKANYAFIDSQNLNMGTQRMGWKMDWKKFRVFLRDHYNVEKAYMFIGYLPDMENLYRQMQDAGYTVVLKPTVDMFMTKEELADEKHITKGNADAELVLHAMKELPHYQKAIIVSGDGDFFCLVEYLSEQQRLLHLIAPNRYYSSLYKPFEQFIVTLDEHKRQLAYDYMRPKRRSSSHAHKKT